MTGVEPDRNIIRRHFATDRTLPDLMDVALPAARPTAPVDAVDEVLSLVSRLYLRRLLVALFDGAHAELASGLDVQIGRWLEGPTEEVHASVRGPELSTVINLRSRDDTRFSTAEYQQVLQRALTDTGVRGAAGRLRVVPMPDWFWERCAPTSAPSPPAPGSADQTVVKEAVELVREVWPAAHRRLARLVDAIVPLDPQLSMTGYTSHLTRGAVWAALRNPTELALTMVHEQAHQLMCSLIDLTSLAHNQTATSTSPYGEPRPIYGVFHAALSFVTEAQFCDLLLRSGVRSSGHWLYPEMDRYSVEIHALARRSVDQLASDAVFTEPGHQLCTALHTALEAMT